MTPVARRLALRRRIPAILPPGLEAFRTRGLSNQDEYQRIRLSLAKSREQVEAYVRAFEVPTVLLQACRLNRLQADLMNAVTGSPEQYDAHVWAWLENVYEGDFIDVINQRAEEIRMFDSVGRKSSQSGPSSSDGGDPPS